MSKIAVIDLDGCLCSVNTFRYWIIYTYFILFLTLHWFSFLKFNSYIVMRLFRRSNRVQMKRDILGVTESLSECYVRYFCKILHLFTNQKVLLEIEKLKERQLPVVLCTAAPMCYVDTYADKYGFSTVFATESISNGVWVENFRDEKLVSIARCYGADVEFECVITDHHDDLPLLVKAKKCILVNPSNATLRAVTGRIDFDIIK